MQREFGFEGFDLIDVSILTRPWGRVQPPISGATARIMRPFQSSPARGGGCNALEPHGGANQEIVVSILTRPWGRVQRANTGDNQHRRVDVSILTRPWGRVQHRTRACPPA